MITLDTVELPGQMFWSDEIEWSPVQQEEGYSVTGSLLLDVSEKLAGRPVTLGGRDYTCWVPRSTVLALTALAAIPNRTMALTLEDGRTFQVKFRYKDDKPVEGKPIQDQVPIPDDAWYTLTIRLIIV